jgi:hypothetical protein
VVVVQALLLPPTNSTIEQLRVLHTGSAVNYLTVAGSATGSSPVFSVAGTDTNIDLTLTPKGTGKINVSSTTASTSTTTGALTVAGGLGVAGDVYVGGAVFTPDQTSYDVVTSVFPTIRPSLNLDFANSKVVDERITFTRSTNATYYDADGLLKTALSNRPRLDHDPLTRECKGLLIKEKRTNILTSTDRFTNSTSWNSSLVNVVRDVTTAPDGSMTADLLLNTTTSSRQTLYSSANTVAERVTDYTFSL